MATKEKRPRIWPKLAQRIDAERGDVTFERYLNRRLEEAVEIGDLMDMEFDEALRWLTDWIGAHDDWPKFKKAMLAYIAEQDGIADQVAVDMEHEVDEEDES